MKRMIHPDHGAHHAMNANEEQLMRAAGWTDEDEAPAVVEKSEPVEDEAPAVKRPYIRRNPKD